MSQVKYNRIILKISGEALAGEKGTGIDPTVIKKLAHEIKLVHDMGVQVGVVCGGGNMWRGETGAKLGMERAQADYMGMLATIMNGLALQDGLETAGVQTRLQTSISMRQVAEPYIRRSQSATWKRTGSLFSAAALATHTSQLTPRLLCGQRKLTLT